MIKNPIDLLTHFRFDVLIKFLYAKSKLRNYKTNFFKEMYKEHLRLWNGFNEYNNPFKNSFESFDDEFNKILESIKINGFDSSISDIPAVDGKYIVNGAHRLASCLALNKELQIRPANMPEDGQMDCSWYNLFRNLNLPEKYSNVASIEYVKLKQNTYVVTLFPSANGDYKSAIDIINKYGNLIYYRKLDIKKNGPLNLIRELYYGEEWAGNHTNNYKGFREKEKLCFTTKNPTWVFLAEFDNIETSKMVKKEIRDIHKVGNHSVHINDTHEQSLRLSRILFNDNSIHHLNYSKIVYYEKFNFSLLKFKKYLEENNLDLDEYVIVGSSPLSSYGLRESNDLDYIHFNKIKIQDDQDLIHSHNEYGLDLYVPNYDEIIFNPEFHFYHMGVKFASLDVIKKMKIKRNEYKDVLDIDMINNII